MKLLGIQQLVKEKVTRSILLLTKMWTFHFTSKKKYEGGNMHYRTISRETRMKVDITGTPQSPLSIEEVQITMKEPKSSRAM